MFSSAVGRGYRPGWGWGLGLQSISVTGVKGGVAVRGVEGARGSGRVGKGHGWMHKAEQILGREERQLAGPSQVRQRESRGV